MGRRRPGEGSSRGIPDWRMALWTALLAVELVATVALLYVLEPGLW